MSHGQGGHGVVEGDNKKIAILISVLALFLAIAETLGKSAQTDALSSNVEASNLWAFYQAKTIRKTTMETAAEQMEVDVKLAKDANVKDVLEKRVNEWKERAARYESEPKPNGKGEGRKELMARALQAESHRDIALAKYHNFELGSAAFQIAIVLASSYLITGVIYLLWGAAGVGALGIFFTAIGDRGAACVVVPRRALIGLGWRKRAARRKTMARRSLRHRAMGGETVLGAMIFEFFVARHAADPATRRLPSTSSTTWSTPASASRRSRCCAPPAAARHGADGARAARGVPLHRPRARCRRARHDGADGGDAPSRRARIAEAAHYPPKGRRGRGLRLRPRRLRAAAIPRRRCRRPIARNLVIAQIETERGLEAVEEIAAVDGIDCLWLGHFDLTNFLGIPGQFDNPRYIDAVKRIVAAGRKHKQGARLHGGRRGPGQAIQGLRLQHDRHRHRPGHPDGRRARYPVGGRGMKRPPDSIVRRPGRSAGGKPISAW